jgi:hypothetical protein
MPTNIPAKLYKYQDYTPQTLDNLKGRRIWFSKPENFNDPFDCAIPFRVTTEVSTEDLKAIYKKYQQEVGSKQELDEKMLSGDLSEELKARVIRAAVAASLHKRPQYRNVGVACFSEKVDDLLMWSHYANGHRGFCLEFDTHYAPFAEAGKLHQVKYSHAYPGLNPVDVILGRMPHLPAALLTTKSEQWSYEREWRIIHNEGNKECTVEAAALTGVYLGCEIPPTHRDILVSILAGSPTRLFEGRRSETNFKLDFRAVE